MRLVVSMDFKELINEVALAELFSYPYEVLVGLKFLTLLRICAIAEVQKQLLLFILLFLLCGSITRESLRQ